MPNPTRLAGGALAIVAMALIPEAARSQGAPECEGEQSCVAVTNLVAKVNDFRTSTVGRQRVVTLTVRFQNRTDGPLRLGYMDGSGVATDDRGNRYLVHGNANAVRGIGQISRNSFDPKFLLEAGEWGDARFEMAWEPSSRDIIGTRWVVEMAVREIDSISVSQHRLGREYVLQFPGLGAPETPVVATPAPAAPAAPVVTVSRDEACAGRSNCYPAGPFKAEIVRLTPSGGVGREDHVLRINARFTNLTNQPLVLAYSARSSIAIDEYGNPYHWGRANTVDGSVTGMGISSTSSADAQFQLRPGESRDATFQVRRYGTTGAIGATFGWDVAVEQLEPLPGGQVRVVRQHSLSFAGLTSGITAPAAEAEGGRSFLERLRDAVRTPPPD